MPEQDQSTDLPNNPPPAYRVPHKISANTTVNSDSDEEYWSDDSFPDGPNYNPNVNPSSRGHQQPTPQTPQSQFRQRLSLPSRQHVQSQNESTDASRNPFLGPAAAADASRNYRPQNHYGQPANAVRPGPAFSTHGLTTGTPDSVFNPHGPTAGPPIGANASSFGGHHSYYAGDYMIPYYGGYHDSFATPPPPTAAPSMHRPMVPPQVNMGPGGPQIPQYNYAMPSNGYPNGNVLGNSNSYTAGYPNYHYPTPSAVPPASSFSPPKVSIRPPPSYHPQPQRPQVPPPRYTELPEAYHRPRRGNPRPRATMEREYEGPPGRRQGQRRRSKSTSRPAAYVEDDLDDTVIRDREILEKAEQRIREREEVERRAKEKKEEENAKLKKTTEREKELERKVRQLESEREKEKERQLLDDKVQVAVDHMMRRRSHSTNGHELSTVGNSDLLLRGLEVQRMIDDLSRLLPHASERFIGRQDVFNSLSPSFDHSMTIGDLLERSLRANSSWPTPRTSPQAVPRSSENGIPAVVIHELLQRMRKIEQATSVMLRQKSTRIYGVPEEDEENDENQNDLGYIVEQIQRLTASIGTGPDTKRLREGEVGDNYSTDGAQSDIHSIEQGSTNKGRSGVDLGMERRRRSSAGGSTTHTKPRPTPRRHGKTAHFEDQPEEEEQAAERARHYIHGISTGTTPSSRRGTSNMNTKATRQAAVHQGQDEYDSESDALSTKLKREPRKYAKAGYSIREPIFEGARPPPSVPDPPMAPPS